MEFCLLLATSPPRIGVKAQVHGYQAGVELWPLDPWFKTFAVRYGGFEHDMVIGPLFIYCRRISDIQRYTDLG